MLKLHMHRAARQIAPELLLATRGPIVKDSSMWHFIDFGAVLLRRWDARCWQVFVHDDLVMETDDRTLALLTALTLHHTK